MVGNTLLAYDAEIDGIYYNLSGDEAEVTYKTENAEDNYAGDVVIPESVTYMDKEYRVTSIGRKAFFYCKDKVFVTIPKSVNVIGFLAFGGWKSRLPTFACKFTLPCPPCPAAPGTRS